MLMLEQTGAEESDSHVNHTKNSKGGALFEWYHRLRYFFFQEAEL